MESYAEYADKSLLWLPILIRVVFTLVVGALFTLMLLFGQPVE